MKREENEPRLDAGDERFAEPGDERFAEPGDERFAEPGDERFAAKLADAYAPEPQTPEQRMAFARALEARLERPRRRSAWLPALAGIGAAAAMAWMVLSPAPAPDSAPAGALVAAEGARSDLEWQLFYPDQLLDERMDAASERRDDGLPDEYVAIASFLND